jgi:hypothetical protein
VPDLSRVREIVLLCCRASLKMAANEDHALNFLNPVSVYPEWTGSYGLSTDCCDYVFTFRTVADFLRRAGVKQTDDTSSMQTPDAHRLSPVADRLVSAQSSSSASDRVTLAHSLSPVADRSVSAQASARFTLPRAVVSPLPLPAAWSISPQAKQSAAAKQILDQVPDARIRGQLGSTKIILATARRQADALTAHARACIKDFENNVLVKIYLFHNSLLIFLVYTGASSIRQSEHECETASTGDQHAGVSVCLA